jgi:hypothetical protein
MQKAIGSNALTKAGGFFILADYSVAAIRAQLVDDETNGVGSDIHDPDARACAHSLSPPIGHDVSLLPIVSITGSSYKFFRSEQRFQVESKKKGYPAEFQQILSKRIFMVVIMKFYVLISSLTA